jgi:putative FmdB family regulatory protein
MPFFDYRCLNCDLRFEVLQKIDEPAPSMCPACEQYKLEKLISAPAIQSSAGSGGHVHGPGCRH